MNVDALGPLERAALRALVQAEALGVPALTAEQIWRTMPGYSTHLGNVKAALDDPRALGRFVVTDGVRYAARDRGDALAQAADGRRRGRAAWAEVAPTLRGLAKLPWIEAVAVVGPWAFGCAPSNAPITVALLAEGHRGRAAQAAFVASLRSRGAAAESIQLVQVYDADAAMDTSTDARLLLATARPVTHPAAWAWLRARDTEGMAAWPNAPWDASDPDHLLADRLDGRLAVFRRSLLAGPDAVTLAVDRRGRRRLLLDRVFGGLVRRLAGETSIDPIPVGDQQQRWSEVAAWELDPPASKAEAPRPEKDAAPVQPELPLAPPRESSEGRPSRRRRGPQRRPRRTATAASAGTGRRSGRR